MAEVDPTPRCDHHPRCGGCPLLSLDRGEESERKVARVRAALDRQRSLREVAVAALREAPSREAYRRRLKWVSDGHGAIGLYAASEDHVVVDTTDCLVAAPVPKQVAAELRALLPAHLEVRDALPAIDVREVDDDQALVTLVFSEGRRPSTGSLGAFCEALTRRAPSVIGVAENETARGAVQVLGARTRVLRGVEEARATLGDVHVLATYGSFVQAHIGQAARLQRELVERVLAMDLGRPVRVLELFAGGAPFGLALAKRGAAVTAVESFEPAARRIARAAREQGLTIDARAEDATDFVRGAASGSFDVVLVDPPRRGLSRPLRSALAALAPAMIAYVSCDPDTLARDLADLIARGYAPDQVRPMDMMPHTREVESLTYLFPAPAPPARVHHASALGRVVEGATPESTASGLRLEGKPELRQLEVDVLAKGVTHGRGRLFSEGGYEGRYRRVAVIGGHTHARVTCVATGAERISPFGAILRGFARIGHPVLGDDRRCDAATLRFMQERCGVDRPMLDTRAVTLADGAIVSAEPAGDFALASARLSGADDA